MPVSTQKSILFARAQDGKQVHLWPVATFNKPQSAKAYASMLKIAYKSGNHEAVAALDPAHRKTAEGAPIADVKWSIVVVPYEPSPVFGDDDGEVSVE